MHLTTTGSIGTRAAGRPGRRGRDSHRPHRARSDGDEPVGEACVGHTRRPLTPGDIDRAAVALIRRRGREILATARHYAYNLDDAYPARTRDPADEGAHDKRGRPRALAQDRCDPHYCCQREKCFHGLSVPTMKSRLANPPINPPQVKPKHAATGPSSSGVTSMPTSAEINPNRIFSNPMPCRVASRRLTSSLRSSTVTAISTPILTSAQMEKNGRRLSPSRASECTTTAATPARMPRPRAAAQASPRSGMSGCARSTGRGGSSDIERQRWHGYGSEPRSGSSSRPVAPGCRQARGLRGAAPARAPLADHRRRPSPRAADRARDHARPGGAPPTAAPGRRGARAAENRRRHALQLRAEGHSYWEICDITGWTYTKVQGPIWLGV
jgi:hypothetical protein